MFLNVYNVTICKTFHLKVKNFSERIIFGKYCMKPLICMPLLAAMSLTACATIIRGDSENIAFTSSPQGASVSTTTGIQCTTPCDA
ncbi:MAG: hypothetical protein N2B02_05325, partial [Amylibacter sp.]